MLPQLWGGAYAMPGLAAHDALPAFLEEFIAPVEIVTELRSKLGSGSVARLFRRALARQRAKRLTDATTLDAANDDTPLAHHSRLDARIISSMFADYCRRMCWKQDPTTGVPNIDSLAAIPDSP